MAALTGEPPAQPTSDDADHDNRANHDNQTDRDADHNNGANRDADHDSSRAGDAGNAEVIAYGCRAASVLVTRRHRLTRPRLHRRTLTMIRERRW